MRWSRLPDRVVLALYWLAQPIMHPGRGRCRMPDLCLAQSYVLLKRDGLL